MTEGLFAVLGALVGAAGAWIAALIAGRAARYQADKQAAAAHEQWLRQIRRDLYTNFLDRAQAGIKAHVMAVHDLLALEELPDGAYQRHKSILQDNADSLTRTATAMRLEAAPELAPKVRHFADDYVFSAWKLISGDATNFTLDTRRELHTAAMEKNREFESNYSEIEEICRRSIQENR